MTKLFEQLKKGLEDIVAYKKGELDDTVLRKTVIEVPDAPKRKQPLVVQIREPREYLRKQRLKLSKFL